jgi:hypothetical protein
MMEPPDSHYHKERPIPDIDIRKYYIMAIVQL